MVDVSAEEGWTNERLSLDSPNDDDKPILSKSVASGTLPCIQKYNV